jgi:hypothetical protein
MIVLNLVCLSGHRFEGWFASVSAFEDQAAKALVNCPYCNHTEIQRLPSAPMVTRGASHSESTPQSEPEVGAIMSHLRRLADISEDVGDMFPDEARRIHYGQTPERSIRGHASIGEVKDLLEEGIPVLPVPEKKQTH